MMTIIAIYTYAYTNVAEALLLKMGFGNMFYYDYLVMTPDDVRLHVRARKPYNPHREDLEPQPAKTLVPLFRTGQKLGLRQQQSRASYLGRTPHPVIVVC